MSDEFDVDVTIPPPGRVPDTDPSDLPAMTSGQFRVLLDDVMTGHLEPVHEQLAHVRHGLGTVTDRIGRLEADQKSLRAELRRPSIVAWAALGLALLDAGGIVVLLAQEVFR